MAYEIVLNPAGHLHLREAAPDDEGARGEWAEGAAAAFADCQAAGLFAMAAARPDSPPPPEFTFWRDFACRYLAELCRTPESAGADIEPIAPPPQGDLASLTLSAPPMPGGEYLSPEALQGIWEDLDAWAREEVRASAGGLSSWLKRRAPLWHQVGRVCFHLAENKRDPECPFAFLATYAPRISGAGRVQYQPLGKALREYAGEKNKRALAQLLAPVSLAAEKSAFVRELVESGDVFHPLAWTPREAHKLLVEAPLLEECGLLMRLPDWWRKRPRPRVGVVVGDKRPSRFGANAMLDFRVSVALGDEELTADELRRLLESEDGLAYVKGQWVEVDKDKLAQALEHWKQVEAEAGEDGISFIEGMRLLAGAPAGLDDDGDAADEREWSFATAGGWLGETLGKLRDPGGLGGGLPAEGFVGTLRPYQTVGRDWLWTVSNLGLGACLADDMGLGKTVQVLALIVALKESGRTAGKPSLLVLPASLLANWKDEMRRFSPRLKPLFVHPSETPKAELDALTPADAARADVVLTTYGMLMRRQWLLDVDWRLAVLDEAQAIKNPGTRQTRAVKKLKADARLALTGTPVENRLSDVWSLFDFLCPGLLGSINKFKRFVKNLENRPSDRYAPLRNLVRPYVLRRLKSDKSIIADLPDKTEVKAFCGLTRKQAALYAKAVEDLARSLNDLEGIERRGVVLAFLTKFKQICNHPSHFLGDNEYAPDASGKFERLKGLCEEVASRQEKALVFTQYREMTEPLEAFLADVFGRGGLVLHGGTPVGKRRAMVEAFQSEDGPPFFVLSLKAGGTGLNLTAASHVVHFDRWWNPAVENQATDRAYRIGQHRNVLAHKFVCRGTVEEKIDALIDEKTDLAENILKGGGEALLTEMSDAELLQTVALDIGRACE